MERSKSKHEERQAFAEQSIAPLRDSLSQAKKAVEKVVTEKDDLKEQVSSDQRVIERMHRHNDKNEKEKARLTFLAHELIKQAEHDNLTGLLNRKGLENVIEKMQAAGIEGTVVILDIDRFKTINDQFSHDMGDNALVAVAKNLRNKFRITDPIALVPDSMDPAPENVGRWGGEEIVIYFPNWEPEKVLEKLKEMHAEFRPEESGEARINVNFDFEDSVKRPDNLITFSGGIVRLGTRDNLKEVLKKADEALYEIKKSGRNEIKMAA